MVSLLQPSLLAHLCRVCIRRRSTSKRPNGRRQALQPGQVTVRHHWHARGARSRGPPAASPVQSQVSAIPVLMQFACMSSGSASRIAWHLPAGQVAARRHYDGRLAVLYRDLGKPWQWELGCRSEAIEPGIAESTRTILPHDSTEKFIQKLNTKPLMFFILYKNWKGIV